MFNGKTNEPSPAVLTIAGSDSGGNAGVQADIRAFHFFRLHACTVFAALTAQNPDKVSAVMNMTPEFIEAQLDAVFGVYSVGAVKTGMLSAPEAVEAVAGRLSRHRSIPVVVDPVMVATSGASLLNGSAVDAVVHDLLPLADLITPNIPEAEVLCGVRAESLRSVVEMAKALAGKFSCAVYIKGGHNTEDPFTDVFCNGSETFFYRTACVENPLSTHGTGCSFSAAAAAAAAGGDNLADAVRKAKAYVYESIRTGFRVGGSAYVLGTPARLPLDSVSIERVCGD